MKLGSVTIGLLLSLYIGAAIAAEKGSMAEADSLFAKQEYAQAGKLYAKIAKQEKDNGLVWWRLGYCNHLQQKWKDAIDAYKKADELKFGRAVARYNIACAFSMMGEVDSSFAWLEKANASGFRQFEQFEKDTDLENLRSTEKWASFKDDLMRASYPCEYNDRYKELDFCVGDWNVFTMGAGQFVGTNKIEKQEHGCRIHETWRANGGSGGVSINFWNPETERWNQIWNDAAGQYFFYEGGMKDGKFVLEGVTYEADGKSERSRMMMWPLDDGSVRQTIEQYSDEKTEWWMLFDGIYKKQ